MPDLAEIIDYAVGVQAAKDISGEEAHAIGTAMLFMATKTFIHIHGVKVYEKAKDISHGWRHDMAEGAIDVEAHLIACLLLVTESLMEATTGSTLEEAREQARIRGLRDPVTGEAAE
jgi:hypothetical protein